MRNDVDDGERRRKKVGEALLMVGLGAGQRWADPDSVARCFVRLPCVWGTKVRRRRDEATVRYGGCSGARKVQADDL